ncbi:hypothetical protein FIBSPDRAFT_889142 [Athelia psychrophila]|uniref:YDG domain-containing protein n=1 Tax=Athelia psychrophila TaxID=1759441 RepID=A0A166MDP6_9AGAM|nr:hypothetical protein FIBSPDRAFT_889142 [Fibularhizoctonia sp. CBS 109695]
MDNSLQAQISAQISAEILQAENVGAQVADANANANLMQANISAQISAEHSQTENVGAQMADNIANPNGVPEAALPSYGPPAAHQNPLVPAVGTIWTSRQALCNAKMHNNVRSGISVGRNGANAVVLSGGYEDDYSINNGETVYYTGAGGRDRPSGRSYMTGVPIKLFQGFNADSRKIHYRFEGFYQVTRATMRQGSSGFLICRFKLVSMTEEAKSSTIAGWPGCLKSMSIMNIVPFLHEFNQVQISLSAANWIAASAHKSLEALLKIDRLKILEHKLQTTIRIPMICPVAINFLVTPN